MNCLFFSHNCSNETVKNSFPPPLKDWKTRTTLDESKRLQIASFGNRPSSSWQNLDHKTTDINQRDVSYSSYWKDDVKSLKFTTFADISKSMMENTQDKERFSSFSTQQQNRPFLHDTDSLWEPSLKPFSENQLGGLQVDSCETQTTDPYRQANALTQLKREFQPFQERCILDEFPQDTEPISTHDLSTRDAQIMAENSAVLRWTKVARRVQYRKTKKCPWYAKGRCWLNSQCNYAHHDAELQHPPDLTRTKICVQGTKCRDDNCRFAHTLDELRSTDVFFRTKLCKFWSSGLKCPLGENCRHAHGVSQMRPIPSADMTNPHHSSPYLRSCRTEEGCASPIRTSVFAVSSPPNYLKTFTPEKSNTALDCLSIDSTQYCEKLLQKVHYRANDSATLRSYLPDEQRLSVTPSLSFQSDLTPPQVNFHETSTLTFDSSFHSHTSHYATSHEDTRYTECEAQPLQQCQGSCCFSPSSLSQLHDTSLENCVGHFPCKTADCIELRDVLHLAVTSCDPDLLKCSDQVLQASVKLKAWHDVQHDLRTYSGKEYTKETCPIYV